MKTTIPLVLLSALQLQRDDRLCQQAHDGGGDQPIDGVPRGQVQQYDGYQAVCGEQHAHEDRATEDEPTHDDVTNRDMTS